MDSYEESLEKNNRKLLEEYVLRKSDHFLFSGPLDEAVSVVTFLEPIHDKSLKNSAWLRDEPRFLEIYSEIYPRNPVYDTHTDISASTRCIRWIFENLPQSKRDKKFLKKTYEVAKTNKKFMLISLSCGYFSLKPKYIMEQTFSEDKNIKRVALECVGKNESIKDYLKTGDVSFIIEDGLVHGMKNSVFKAVSCFVKKDIANFDRNALENHELACLFLYAIRKDDTELLNLVIPTTHGDVLALFGFSENKLQKRSHTDIFHHMEWKHYVSSYEEKDGLEYYCSKYDAVKCYRIFRDNFPELFETQFIPKHRKIPHKIISEKILRHDIPLDVEILLVLLEKKYFDIF